ncbi:NrdH-redoxin [bacterium (Candidatus Torokbacteria) CG09_land_8_20_14_0_10_42_11]|nr:MAG: NrdH-redoxin [bacterium (Candidatus Torokbacteria) CG09_land_8_20_14_0_10_42_11]
MKIKIYSTPTCPHCVTAKDYLKENNIEFEEVNVGADQKAAEEMIQKTNQMGVPVITVEKEGKEEIILGFDREKIDQIILKK